MDMLVFSNDVDILKYEAVVFGDLHFGWQVLCEGAGGEVSGTSFTKTGEDFVSAGVGAGGVIYLKSADGMLDGAYEIVSVDSASEVIISVLRADSEGDAVGPGDASDVSYRVSTFGPQANEVGFELTQYFGIRPGRPDSEYDADDIVDSSGLRSASVYGVLAKVYMALAVRLDGDDGFWKKSLHYQGLFERAKERCRVSVDIDGDGIGERTIVGGSLRLVRD
jgi:hypothetical protein